jgi:hypothetical protein
MAAYSSVSYRKTHGMVVGVNVNNIEHATTWQSTQRITSPTGIVIPCVQRPVGLVILCCSQVLLDSWSFAFVSPVGLVIICVRESCWNRDPLCSRVLLESRSFVFASPVGIVILRVRESCWNRDPLCSRVLLYLWLLCSWTPCRWHCGVAICISLLTMYSVTWSVFY